MKPKLVSFHLHRPIEGLFWYQKMAARAVFEGFERIFFVNSGL